MIAAEFAYLDARVNLYARQLLELDQINSLIDQSRDEDTRDPSQADAALHDADDLDQSNVNILLSELTILVRPLVGRAARVAGLLGAPLRTRQSQDHHSRQDGQPAAAVNRSAAAGYGCVHPPAHRRAVAKRHACGIVASSGTDALRGDGEPGAASFGTRRSAVRARRRAGSPLFRGSGATEQRDRQRPQTALARARRQHCRPSEPGLAVALSLRL